MQRKEQNMLVLRIGSNGIEAPRFKCAACGNYIYLREGDDYLHDAVAFWSIDDAARVVDTAHKGPCFNSIHAKAKKEGTYAGWVPLRELLANLLWNTGFDPGGTAVHYSGIGVEYEGKPPLVFRPKRVRDASEQPLPPVPGAF
jgi:hypothetical protein